KIKRHLSNKGIDVDDHGTNSPQSVDYPDYAFFVAEQVAAGKVQYGILVCGSGIGMSIAANKVHGVRAAHVTSEVEAQLSREHNDANVLAIGGRTLEESAAYNIELKIFQRSNTKSRRPAAARNRCQKFGSEFAKSAQRHMKAIAMFTKNQ